MVRISRNYALTWIESIAAVQWENKWLWIHNHNDKSYTIYVAKPEWLITRNSKHVKQAQITTDQYLWDQLDKHIVTDPLEDILKQVEKQTPMNHT